MQADPTSPAYRTILEAIEACQKKFPDVVSYATKNKCRERSLADMIGISNDLSAASRSHGDRF